MTARNTSSASSVSRRHFVKLAGLGLAASAGSILLPTAANAAPATRPRTREAAPVAFEGARNNGDVFGPGFTAPCDVFNLQAVTAVEPDVSQPRFGTVYLTVFDGASDTDGNAALGWQLKATNLPRGVRFDVSLLELVFDDYLGVINYGLVTRTGARVSKSSPRAGATTRELAPRFYPGIRLMQLVLTEPGSDPLLATKSTRPFWVNFGGLPV